jgi:hypothetical protein
MPELHDLLTEEANRQQPTSNRPFTDLVKTRRRRDRTVRFAGVGVVGALAIAGVALAGTFTGGGGHTAVVGDGEPSPTLTQSVADTHLCDIRGLDISLDWVSLDNGSLKGTLVAKNTGDSACRLTGKPQVIPLLDDGKTAGVRQGQSLEKGSDVVVPTGYVSSATVTWDSWCSATTGFSGKLMVSVNGNGTVDPAVVTITPTNHAGSADGTLSGRLHPACTAGANSDSFMHVTFFGGAFDPAPLVPPVPGAAVSGTLELVGGPAGNSSRGVQGTVTATSTDGRTQSAIVGSSGEFTFHLTSGTYTVTGTSPMYNSGQGTCRADQPVTVDGPTGGVIVACQMK